MLQLFDEGRLTDGHVRGAQLSQGANLAAT